MQNSKCKIIFGKFSKIYVPLNSLNSLFSLNSLHFSCLVSFSIPKSERDATFDCRVSFSIPKSKREAISWHLVRYFVPTMEQGSNFRVPGIVFDTQEERVRYDEDYRLNSIKKRKKFSVLILLCRLFLLRASA